MASDNERKSTVSSMGHHSKHPHDEDVEFYLPKVPLTLQILKRLCSEEDPANATKIKVELDINRNSVQNIGHLIPRLQELNMSNSIIHTLRDLGTGLHHLHTLWICHCNLTDLDGLTSLGAVKELYASYNLISDVSPCTMLDYLETLDLEGNSLADISNLGFLRLCRHLQSLTLVENPLWTESKGDTYGYRLAVQEEVPQLRFLDGMPLAIKHTKGMRSNVTKRTQSLDFIDDDNRKHTCSVPTFSGFGDGAMLRHHSIHEMPRLPSPWELLHPAAETRPTEREPLDEAQAASELTRGDILCGNTARALRKSLCRQPMSAINERRRASEPVSPTALLNLSSSFGSLVIDSNKRQQDDEERYRDNSGTEMRSNTDDEKMDQMKPIVYTSALRQVDLDDATLYDDDDDDDDHGVDMSVRSTDSGVSLETSSSESNERSDVFGPDDRQHEGSSSRSHGRQMSLTMIKDSAAKVMGNFKRRFSEPLQGLVPDAFPKPMRRDVLDVEEEEV